MPRAPQELRTYFITSATASRRRLFQVEQNALLLIEILEEQRKKNRFKLHAFVIMPDHVHLLLTPSPEISLEKAVQFIKGNFSFRLKSKLDVWERSFTNHRVTDEHDYATPSDLHPPKPNPSKPDHPTRTLPILIRQPDPPIRLLTRPLIVMAQEYAAPK
jgi:putative transposase